MNNKVLKAEKVVAGYRDKEILHGVNVTVPRGKISVILGSNGSGKSTLLKTFCRLLQPSSGSIKLGEQSLSHIPTRQIAQNIGLLPQSTTVPEGIKVSELVSRGRFPYRKLMAPLNAKDYEVVEEVMKFMGILELSDARINQLSGGQRQRVFIALALAQQTDILFLDEPTTYLDISYQVEILELLKKLNEERGTTIVMVLHDINLSSRYADHIFAMKNGNLMYQGAPEKIITQEVIREIYGLESFIIEDPVSHSPFVIPKAAAV
ncbi:MAG: ABC transporter ATP-binding protein [Lachnospiraceae bacterium]|nr:ABC transporter ATP-binding protein [Lachnospiraceae bacterium]